MYSYTTITHVRLSQIKIYKYNVAEISYRNYINLKYFYIYYAISKFIFNGDKAVIYKFILNSYIILKYNIKWAAQSVYFLRLSVEYLLRILSSNLMSIYNIFLKKIKSNSRLQKAIYKRELRISILAHCLKGGVIDLFIVSKFIQIRDLLYKLCFFFFIVIFNFNSTILMQNKILIMQHAISHMRLVSLVALYIYRSYFIKKTNIMVSMIKYILKTLYRYLYIFRSIRDYFFFLIGNIKLKTRWVQNLHNININVPKTGYINSYRRYRK